MLSLWSENTSIASRPPRAKMAKALQRREKRNEMSGSPISATLYSVHVVIVCPAEIERKESSRKFTPRWTLRHDIGAAIRASPNRKAAGLDALKNEMLKVDLNLSTRLILASWEACGLLDIAPLLWTKTALIQIYKVGSSSLPENNRPISLLSHMRKIVKTALDKVIQREHKSHRAQLGLGAEVALLHAEALRQQGHGCVAILDLKEA